MWPAGAPSAPLTETSPWFHALDTGHDLNDIKSNMKTQNCLKNKFEADSPLYSFNEIFQVSKNLV